MRSGIDGRGRGGREGPRGRFKGGKERRGCVDIYMLMDEALRIVE